MFKMHLRIGTVKFLNARPLDYGFRNFVEIQKKNKFPYLEISLIEDIPSKLIQYLLENKIDIGMVSSIEALKNLDKFLYYDKLGICSHKKVYSIFYVQKKEFDEKPVKKIFLDKSSRTSNALLKIVYYQKYKYLPEFVEEYPENFISKIDKESGGIIIGDPAIRLYLNQNSFYLKDLAEWWFELTQLPFVFALWVYRRESIFDTDIFEESYLYGKEHMPEIIQKSEFPVDFCQNYFKNALYYEITQKEKESLQKFKEYLEAFSLL